MTLAICTGVAIDSSGNAISGADVEVRFESSGSLASIFSDESASTPLANPALALTDANGRFSFYVAGADRGYSVAVTKGADTYTLHNQAIGTAGQLDQSAFVSASVLTTEGDLLVRGTSSAQRLGIGSNGRVPVVSTGASGKIIWSDPPSFNYGYNDDFEVWGNGTTGAPTSWTLSGTGAAVLKNGTAGQFKFGSFAAQITPSTGGSAQLTQDVDTFSGFGPAAAWQGVVVTHGRWVKAAGTSQARIGINDGITTTYSSYHSGTSSTFEFLSVSATVNGTGATRMRKICEVVAGGTSAQFDLGALVKGGALASAGVMPSGWRGRKCMVFPGKTATGGFGPGLTLFVGIPGAAQSTESQVIQPLPFANQVLRNLYYRRDVVPGTGQTAVATVRVATTDTSLTATLSTANQASDTTHEVYAGAGALFTVKDVTSGGAGTANCIAYALEAEEVPAQ